MDYGSQSMVGKLRRVIVRAPDQSFADADPEEEAMGRLLSRIGIPELGRLQGDGRAEGGDLDLASVNPLPASRFSAVVREKMQGSIAGELRCHIHPINDRFCSA